MADIHYNVSLKPYNTFGIDVRAKYFSIVSSSDDLMQILRNDLFKSEKHFVTGGGSNVLFSADFDGWILRMYSKGIEVSDENEEFVFVKAAAGEIWDDLVSFCLDRNFGGIENLSAIPGTVGAAPVQNIGAYGTELKDVFYSLDAVSVEDSSSRIFTAAECDFGYRDSIFKRDLKDKYIITSATLKLSKKPLPCLTYKALNDQMKKWNISEISIQDVSRAVREIRALKLPDTAVLGNAGSFFKNPLITNDKFKILQNLYKQVPSFPAHGEYVKVPAGWLIEQSGWKGRRIGNAGVHCDQALVIVNYGGATANEILDLAEQITIDVKRIFGILLEKEVNVV